MKLIIEHDEYNSSYLEQYATQVEYLSRCYKLIDIQEKYLSWLTQMAAYVEPNFILKLNGEREIGEVNLDHKNTMTAYIGTKQFHGRVDAYYNIPQHTWEEVPKLQDSQEISFISCYSDNNIIEAGDYIKCIRHLASKANACQKAIIIYADIYVPNETYRYRALTYKIINSYLKNMKGMLILKTAKSNTCKYYNAVHKPFEFYLDYTIYLEDCFEDAVKKALPLLQGAEVRDNNAFKNIYHMFRQEGSLYDDIFYKSIPPEQEIYVLLNSGNYRAPEYYENLGFDAIPLIGDYSMLYAKKSLFDLNSQVLRAEVAPQYYMPVLSYGFCYKGDLSKKTSFNLVPDNLKYKGKGVYIGMIGVEGVDYTNPILRLPDGRTRIAGIWEQTKADEGVFYPQDRINEALNSENPSQVIGFPQGDSMTNMVLSIAGGDSRNDNYRGIAPEAEFLIAKINRAPDTLQRIYGGIPSENGVLMADAVIGAMQLTEFARAAGKPLVLCMPYNGNVDAHDGTFMLNQILNYMAQRTSLSMIVPSGEEADKLHHQGIEGKQETLKIVNIRVEKEEQNTVGVIYQKFSTIFTALLYPPQEVESEPINLKRAAVTRVGERTTVYSNGERINFANGAKEILFRIDNPQVGGWRIELTLETELGSKIDIWLAQQELNGYTTLRPSSAFLTIGSSACISSLMGVGGYDRETMVVLKSSGRGYNWNNEVRPLFVTHASNILASCRSGQLDTVTGTMVAASIMVGVTAVLYSKFIEENFFPLPNTLIMNSIILDTVTQFEGVEYPNPSQGYGIFDIQSLGGLLATPFVL